VAAITSEERSGGRDQRRGGRDERWAKAKKEERERSQRGESDRRWEEMAERIKRARDATMGEIQEILEDERVRLEREDVVDWAERGRTRSSMNLELPGRAGKRVLAEMSQQVRGEARCWIAFIKFLVGSG
jgi:hypothetical protein